MILPTQSSITGLPQILESRNIDVPFHAIPRRFSVFAKTDQHWVSGWMAWQGHMLQRVRCWKCGRDIKGWRLAIDQYRNAVTINHQPAVTFTVYDHFRQTPMQAWLKSINHVIQFSVLHCADCVILGEHALEAVTCYLQGVDAQLQQVWSHGHGKQLTRHDWATHLYVWHNAEPVGLGSTAMDVTLGEINGRLLDAKRESGGVVTLPTPGELVTAAHYLRDQLGWSLTGVQPGMMVEYPADPPPAGWIRASAGPVDPTRYPALARVLPVLPDKPGMIVKI